MQDETKELIIELIKLIFSIVELIGLLVILYIISKSLLADIKELISGSSLH